jgi:hypothetical protein
MITAENPAQNISENTADSKDQEIGHLTETIERLTKLNQASGTRSRGQKTYKAQKCIVIA